MLEQAPATAVIHPPECVSARGPVHPLGHAGRRLRRLATRTHACITVLAAALLALGPGCSLLLDFDVAPVDAAAIIDAGPIDAAADAGLIDAAPIDAGAIDAGAIDATTPDAT